MYHCTLYKSAQTLTPATSCRRPATQNPANDSPRLPVPGADCADSLRKLTKQSEPKPSLTLANPRPNPLPSFFLIPLPVRYLPPPPTRDPLTRRRASLCGPYASGCDSVPLQCLDSFASFHHATACFSASCCCGPLHAPTRSFVRDSFVSTILEPPPHPRRCAQNLSLTTRKTSQRLTSHRILIPRFTHKLPSLRRSNVLFGRALPKDRASGPGLALGQLGAQTVQAAHPAVEPFRKC